MDIMFSKYSFVSCCLFIQNLWSNMNKVNARNILSRTCDQFYKTTCEVISLTFTWNGTLTVYGPDAFKQLVTDKKDDIFESLSQPSCNRQGRSSRDKHKSKPLIDEHMRELLDGDIKKYSRSTLRKLVSWAVQVSIGELYSKCYLMLLETQLFSQINLN